MLDDCEGMDVRNNRAENSAGEGETYGGEGALIEVRIGPYINDHRQRMEVDFTVDLKHKFGWTSSTNLGVWEYCGE